MVATISKQNVGGGWFACGCVIRATSADKSQGHWQGFRREQNKKMNNDVVFDTGNWLEYADHSANYNDVEMSIRHEGMFLNTYLQVYANNPDWSAPSFGYRLNSVDDYRWQRFDVNDISYFDFSFQMSDGSKKNTTFRVVRDYDIGEGDNKGRHLFLLYCNWTGPKNDQTINNWET